MPPERQRSGWEEAAANPDNDTPFRTMAALMAIHELLAELVSQRETPQAGEPPPAEVRRLLAAGVLAYPVHAEGVTSAYVALSPSAVTGLLGRLRRHEEAVRLLRRARDEALDSDGDIECRICHARVGQHHSNQCLFMVITRFFNSE